jgi:hypothetical protein
MARAGVLAAVLCTVIPAHAETPPAESKPESGSAFLGFGTELGATHELSYSGHVGLHLGAHSGPSFALTLNAGEYASDTPAYEASLAVSGGYRFGLQTGAWRLFVGPELGAGLWLYSTSGLAPFVKVGPYFGIALEIYRRTFLAMEGHLPVRFARSATYPVHIPSVSFQPGGWLGFTWAF